MNPSRLVSFQPRQDPPKSWPGHFGEPSKVAQTWPRAMRSWPASKGRRLIARPGMSVQQANMAAALSSHPDIDIRIDTTDASVDLDTADVDLALRYTTPAHAPPNAQRLFGEQLTPVASPWLLKSGHALRSGDDLAHFALIEAGDAHRNQHLEWLTWRRWLDVHHFGKVEPKRWLFFNYAHQIAQAALTGQGVALARMPMVADSLACGDLVEILPGMRLDSPLAYWLIVGPRSAARPEIKAFCDWLTVQAALTRQATGETP